jgi:hypothetical protein
MLGKASAALYVGTIAVMALACGAALDAVAQALPAGAVPERVEEVVPAWAYAAGGIILAAYLLHAVGRWVYRKVSKGRAHDDACGATDEACRGGAPCGCGGDEPTHPHHDGA